MHDVILAKQIIDEVVKVAKAKKLDSIELVSLEIGSVALAHNNVPGHVDEVDPGNLKFILGSMAPKYGLGKAKFDIKKITGSSWRILEIKT